jgi:flavin reductase (DIM6/NTAB) family NADH-FMN oxidoreductase RutF/pimeloyl-ACP methyl ester carboxylesterase
MLTVTNEAGRRFEGSGGVRLAADVGGDPNNPAVLLLPGRGQTRGVWAQAAKALVTAGRYVVSLDLRGHGESDWSSNRDYDIDAIVRDIEAVVEEMPSRPAIVGAGLGGLAALIAVTECNRPLATALVLVDAAPRMSIQGLDRLAFLIGSDADGFYSVEEAAQVIAAYLPVPTAPDLSEVQRHLRRRDDGRFRWNVDPAFRFKLDARFRIAIQERFVAAATTLDIPTCMIWGERSLTVVGASVESFRELVPHAELVELPGVGNAIIGERNDAFDVAILDFLERAVPRAGSLSQNGVMPRVLRDAMGCFATGVTVITTLDEEDRPVGLTANSFASVSLDPPLVLFCIKRESASVAPLQSRRAFAVNVLHIGQQAISTKFASRTEDRFADIEWEQWDYRVPIILDAMANFECSIQEMIDGGDHLIVLGRVERVRFDPSRDPLLFLQGKYRRMHMGGD